MTPVVYLLMLVGTYTDAGSPGLFSFRLNTETGEIAPSDSCMVENASYLALNADSTVVYAISENNLDNSLLSAVSLDRSTGKFGPLSYDHTVRLSGGSPCYVSANGRFAATANYGGGTVSVVALDTLGFPVEECAVIAGGLGGTDKTRQNLPHVHSVVFSPDGKRLFATDFSSDRILYFDVTDTVPFLVAPDGTAHVDVANETGPRHLVFDNSATHAYLIGELSGTVTVFDVVDNTLKVKQTVNADPAHGRASADIRLSPDGRFLYATNRRANDGIAIFAVEPATGLLSPVGYRTTGQHPRNIAITPDGKFLLAACRDSNNIEVYRRDSATGLLSHPVSTLGIARPVCILFAPN